MTCRSSEAEMKPLLSLSNTWAQRKFHRTAVIARPRFPPQTIRLPHAHSLSDRSAASRKDCDSTAGRTQQEEQACNAVTEALYIHTHTHTRLTLKASIISCCMSDQNAARCSLEELSGGDSDEVFFKKEELISGFGDFADVCDLNSGEPFA